MGLIFNSKAKFLLCLLALSLLTFNNCFADKSGDKKQQIIAVAQIDNQVITNIDLINRYNFLLSASPITVNSVQERQLLINQILQKMIDESLQLNEANKLNVNLSDGQLEEAVYKVAVSQNHSLDEFKNFFKENNLSYDSYLKQLKSQILWNKIVSNIVSKQVKVSDIEIKELLELKKIKRTSLKLSLSEIYIPFDYQINDQKVDAEKLVNKLANELRKDEKSSEQFVNIAEHFSRSATSEFGGQIGWVGEDDIDPEVYNLISHMTIGQVSEPMVKNDGYYLFKLNDKKVVNNLEEDDINQIRNLIFSKKLQIAAKSYLLELRKKAFIEINKEVLNNL